ncbi:unnamed protein product [Hydatigera taeniaeformis]|uniref:Fibronectin type-III domain-containing protein n=1 Tax=Hydatigena taeniaeformis TaxID=6205 RepID=A0A0R3WYE4_HYDTA|nr:unnamed protein product [Hydatigera taeniaeformis]
MRKPTFSANFLASGSMLQISIDDPQEVEGQFEGYEVLMKNGGLVSLEPWASVAILSPHERSYVMMRIQPQTTLTVTVRGRLSSNHFSALADAVECLGVDRGQPPYSLHPHYNAVVTNAPTCPTVDLSAPTNVKLVALDSHSVLMTWDPPAQSYGLIIGYEIGWLLDGRVKPFIYHSAHTSYTFHGLKAGQTISAGVSATSRPESSIKIRLKSDASLFASVTLPPTIGGKSRSSHFEFAIQCG